MVEADLVVYSGSDGLPWQKLRKILDEAPFDWEPGVHRTVENLAASLAHRPRKTGVAILLIGSRQELERIVSLKEFFRDIRVILILPDRDEQTVATGLNLRPRFFTDIDADFSEISAVLFKMLGVGSRGRFARTSENHWPDELEN